MLLKDYLEEEDMSVEEFCARIGMTFSCVYGYINETVRPNRLSARKIEDFTGGKVLAKELRKIKADKDKRLKKNRQPKAPA